MTKLLNKISTPLYIAMVIALTLLAVMLWVLLGIKAATINYAPVRAVTVAQHEVCKELPRGSQIMEEKKHECFKQLYRGPRYRIDSERMGANSKAQVSD